MKAKEKLGRKKGKQVTKVDKGKQVISNKKYVFIGTCFKCGNDGHWDFECIGVKVDKQNLAV